MLEALRLPKRKGIDIEDVTSIGVMFRREQAPEVLTGYARRAEAAGFDELWVVEDCFFAGGVAQAATALEATERINVGLGILPAVARNPAFVAMEFATLARMHPGRFLPGLGHGVAQWMDQVGARPASWLAALGETAETVRSMLRGEEVNASGKHVKLSKVRLDHPPTQTPPVSLGVRGPKSLNLSGAKADGTILAECAAPEYVSWARGHIARGASDAGRLPGEHRVTVYALCTVNNDPDKARQVMRPIVADVLASGGVRAQIEPLGIAEEVAVMAERGGAGLLAEEMPDEWLDKLAVVGSPEDCALAISRLAEAGASSVVLQPPYDRLDEAWLDEISRELLPRLGSVRGT